MKQGKLYLISSFFLFTIMISCIDNKNKNNDVLLINETDTLIENNPSDEVLEAIEVDIAVIEPYIKNEIKIVNSLNNNSEIPDYITYCTEELTNISYKILHGYHYGHPKPCLKIYKEIFLRCEKDKLELLKNKIEKKREITENERQALALIIEVLSSKTKQVNN